MTPNAMKSRLLSGHPAFGVSIMVPSPQIVEMVGRLGFDWVLIDCEHGTISLETVEILAMAAEAAGITPIARPRTSDPIEILQVLDRGAMGVQVPHVNTADQAREVVRAVKYHPLGDRGAAAGTRPAGYGFGLSMTDYMEVANRETLVCIQIEEGEAVCNADEIVEVDGVDVVFIGPSDLSQSMGLPGDPKAPAVRKAIDDTFAKILSAGRIAGTPSTTGNVREILDKGVLYTYTHVTAMLKAAAEGYFGEAK